MTTETTTAAGGDLFQLTDDEIDSVGGGSIAGMVACWNLLLKELGLRK